MKLSNLTSKKNEWLVILLLCVVLISVGALTWRIVFKHRSSTSPLSRKTGVYLSALRQTLMFYNKEHRNESTENPISDFSHFLVSTDSNFSLQAQDTKKSSEKSIEFFLMLPTELESSNPLLVAYTSSFKYQHRLRSFAMFLRGREYVIVLMPEQVIKEIIGIETFENKKPDLYVHNP